MITRHKFLGTMGAAGATTLAAGIVGLDPLPKSGDSTVQAAPLAQGSNQRANDCAKIRRDVAQADLRDTPPNLQHPANPGREYLSRKLALP